tara:strand:+ start:377 stop:1309 length:933 start_codon:yes stop_codon:yes gene_type:complete
MSEFQRDIFINEIFIEAQKNKNIIFVSADFGAPALDSFRNKLNNQFVHSGISEQHMIDFAAGLSLSGKQVYVYAMAPFITLRCLEQIKCSLAMMELPVTIIAVGVGLGYADAGPTHYLTEDIACMRSIVGLDILSASDSYVTKKIAKLTIDEPKLRLIRLERHPLPVLYNENTKVDLTGICKIYDGKKILVLSYGHVLYRAKEAVEKINKEFDNIIGLIDVFSIKPISKNLLNELNKYDMVLTLEEQCQSGGFGSIILEYISDNNLDISVKRLALDDKYYFENGGREYLLDNHNLSISNIVQNLQTMLGL